MWRIRQLMAKARAFLQHGRADQEMEREIASHLALIAEDFERRGMTAEEARLAAKRAYGGVEQSKELHREARSMVWLEQAWQDLRHATRSLSRSPGFTLIAVLTLSLGIGVNITLFTAYNAVALKPLPVSSPESVVRVKRWLASGGRGDNQFAFSYPEYQHLLAHNRVFSHVAASSWALPVLNGTERVTGQLTSANYFDGLGAAVRLGRAFLPEEDKAPGASPVVVLSYLFWQRRFNGDLNVPGKVLDLNGTPFTVIGVAAEDFTGTSLVPQTPDFWAPLSMQRQLAPGGDWLHSPGDYRFQILARLKPSLPVARAQAEVNGLVLQFARTYVEPDKTESVTLQPTRFVAEADDVRFQAFAGALMLVVGMVLLVACANIANMLLARGAARQRELGIRLALGAGRGRVLRHLLTENLLLALLGGAAGVLISLWTIRLLWLAIAELIEGPFSSVMFKVDLSPDFRVFAYTLSLSFAASLLFGLWPALQATRPDLFSSLKEEGTSFGLRLSRSRLRSLLVGLQVAVTMVLLIGASFLLRGLVRSQSVHPGFETKGLFLLFAPFDQDPVKAALRQRLLTVRLRDVPQVTNAALGGIPMMGTWTPPMISGALRTRTLANYASAEYFATLAIPIVRGRGFSKQETAQEPVEAGARLRINKQAYQSAPRIAVVSESTARYFWPWQDPVGKRFQLDMDFRGTLLDFEVIGVAKDVRYANLTRVDPAHVYLAGYSGGSWSILLRIQGDSQSAQAAVRKAVAAFDNNLLAGLHLAGLEEGPLRLQRSLARASGMFTMVLAFLALTLAGAGIHGVMAYFVSQRVQEIGIRMALGSSQGGVLRAVVLQGLRPVLTGIAFGILGAAALSSALRATLAFPGSIDFFYGVPVYDPATFLGMSLFLIVVAAVASWVPARRALRVDPMTALRHN